MNQLAIVTLTPNGAALGRRLADRLGRGEVVRVDEGARERLAALYQARRPLICVMALGIVVRILGPLALAKEEESPVVVVDEAGQFAISVLGGHRGGANELAREAAGAIGATPVITTASDVLKLPAVDLIGRQLGWTLDSDEHLTAVSAAVVRGDPIAVYQDAGSNSWCAEFGGWPRHFHRATDWPPPPRCTAGIVISDRLQPPAACPTVIYRPRTLVAGVGCKRGVPWDEIDGLFMDLCNRHRFSPLSLALVATVTLKAREPGLLEFAQRRSAPMRIFRVGELAEMIHLPTPSATVQEKIGIPGVAEPSAMLAAGTASLLLPKCRGPRTTMAFARREEP